MSGVVERAVACLEPIGLDALNQAAALQRRYDRKYIVAPEMIARLFDVVDAPLSALDIAGDRTHLYRSVYFDTPQRMSYVAAATGRPRRFKARTRWYASTGTCWLEVKQRGRGGRTDKERIGHNVADLDALDRRDVEFLGSFDVIGDVAARLEPTIESRYRRATVVMLGRLDGLKLACGSVNESTQRMTIDCEVAWHRPNGPIAAGLNDGVVIETKSLTPRPGPFDRVLWRLGARPVSMSKYAVGMATVYPHLASNRWHRVINNSIWTGRPALSLTSGTQP